MTIIRELKIRDGKALIPKEAKEILDVWGFDKELIEWEERDGFVFIVSSKVPYSGQRAKFPSKIKVRYII